MHNLQATIFVYRNKQTKDIRCEYNSTKDVDETKYDHIATIEPRLWIQYHYDDKEKFALMCEKMGMDGYGTLAIAAAIRKGYE
jgi:hypothetical protein